MLSDILLSNYKKSNCEIWYVCVTLGKGRVHRTGKDYDRLLKSHNLHSKHDGSCLKSYWNNQTFIIFMSTICVTWMKVKINIISTCCILMSEATHGLGYVNNQTSKQKTDFIFSTEISYNTDSEFRRHMIVTFIWKCCWTSNNSKQGCLNHTSTN